MKKWISLLGLCGLATLPTMTGCGIFGGEKEGEEGGDCFPNGTCNAGLVCRSNLCVDDGSGPSGDENKGGSGDKDDIQKVAQACLSCGESACADSSCSSASACGKLVACTVKCSTVTDIQSAQSCASDCQKEIQGFTEQELMDGVQEAANFYQCALQSCLSECTVSVDGSGGPGGDDTEPGGGEGTKRGCDSSSHGDTSGACSTNDAVRCEDGTWVPQEECAGCAVLSPRQYCEKVVGFSLQRDPYLPEYVESGPEPISTDIQVTDNGLVAQLVLDYSSSSREQQAVLQIQLNHSVQPSSITISGLSGHGLVTLESYDGGYGCQYIVNSSGKLTLAREGEWNGCWGDALSGAPASPPYRGSNLSIKSAWGVTQATLRVSGISIQ